MLSRVDQLIAKSAAAALSALVASAIPASSAASQPITPSSVATLDMDVQLPLERTALRLLQTPEVQAEMRWAAELYRGHALSRTADGARLLERAVRAIALSAIQYAMLEDTSKPAIMWVLSPAHRWAGMQLPTSGFGVDNPDNMYRMAIIDPRSKYEIVGKRIGAGAAQETFVVQNAIPGFGDNSLEGSPISAVLSGDKIHYSPDGSFTITVDTEPSNAPNHLRIQPDSKVIMIRSSLSDWSAEVPSLLRIRRVGGRQERPALNDREMARRAAVILNRLAPYWLEFFQQSNYRFPPNQLGPTMQRGGGWGFAAGGWFKLRDGQALVATILPLGAKYLGFQLADVWGIAPEYVTRTSSLNGSQAHPNADGSFTYVISARDCGVWNWLDTAGMRTGLFGLRWQGVDPQVRSIDGAVKFEVMQLSDLRRRLPKETKWVNHSQRQEQLLARRISYAKRFNTD